ncbi:hypothetical protein [Pelagicoccus sp. SDUM812003]|uniref:hypothetical protein n=1 Tax=Pelagicoccus sp. SDUM812003 TaxID=3041267 RepID=UPI00280C8AE5|nr:hypothetical protein [Pelagicoccus sp. SDUM812003]MDQ8205182.1 hypothetical protein [Pelagicoccus sp. SDUM812003]
MAFLDKLEKRFGSLAIQNLTIYIIVGQVLTYAMMALRNDQMGILQYMVFRFDLFMSGEVWRILSFMLIPPPAHWIWIAFAWIVFYLMGTSLEAKWGAFRYNLYLLTSVVCVALVGALYPRLPISNYYVAYSVTFGFAYLYPNFELRLYFILPVKMKWLGLFIAGLLIFEFFSSPAPIRWMMIGSLINFPLFFGLDFFRGLKAKQRVTEMKQAKEKFESEPFHTCSVCGATDVSHPERSFRYTKDGAICSECSEQEQQ